MVVVVVVRICAQVVSLACLVLYPVSHVPSPILVFLIKWTYFLHMQSGTTALLPTHMQDSEGRGWYWLVVAVSFLLCDA